MTRERLSAIEIAEQQLLSAITHWRRRQHISAITLAGAAEEILGKRLRALGRKSAFDQIKTDIATEVERSGKFTPEMDKALGTLLNQTRNELKHYEGDEGLEFDLGRDSLEMIERAIYNYQLLTGSAFAEFLDFLGESQLNEDVDETDSGEE